MPIADIYKREAERPPMTLAHSLARQLWQYTRYRRSLDAIGARRFVLPARPLRPRAAASIYHVRRE